MIAEGLYKGTVESYELGESRTGKEQFTIDFLLKEYSPNEQTEYVELEEHEHFRVYLYLTPRAWNMTLGQLRSIGYPSKEPDLLDPMNDDFFDFSGQVGIVEIKHEEWQGETRPKGSLYRSRTLSDEDRSRLVKRLKQGLTEHAKEEAAKKAKEEELAKKKEELRQQAQKELDDEYGNYAGGEDYDDAY